MAASDSIPLHPDYGELLRFFGPDFREDWCNSWDDKNLEEARRLGGTLGADFAKKTPVFVYHNIGLMCQGIHRAYLAVLLEAANDKGSLKVLEVGPGGGQMGLALHTLGFRVSFMDIECMSKTFLAWRLAERHLSLPIYTWQFEDTPHQDIIVCFDVLQHMGVEDRNDLLLWMGEHADVVFANLVMDHTHSELHTTIDLDATQGLLTTRWNITTDSFYEGRQMLLAYGSAVRPRK